MEKALKIYCVDDESSIRDLYLCAFENAQIDCCCFENDVELFDALNVQTCDLIILDIMLEGLDGYEILQKLKSIEKFSHIPVIMVSAKGEEVSKVKGLNLGADDYISKPFGVMELVARVKANTRRKNIETFDDVISGDISISISTHKVFIKNKEVQCTLKEFNLLKLLLQNFEKVIARETILDKVWGTDFFGETRTLDMHIKELRKKLQIYESVCEINTIRGVGYILK